MRLGDGEGGRIDLCGIAGAVSVAVASARDAGAVGDTRCAAVRDHGKGKRGITAVGGQRVRPGTGSSIAAPTCAAG